MGASLGDNAQNDAQRTELAFIADRWPAIQIQRDAGEDSQVNRCPAEVGNGPLPFTPQKIGFPKGFYLKRQRVRFPQTLPALLWRRLTLSFT